MKIFAFLFLAPAAAFAPRSMKPTAFSTPSISTSSVVLQQSSMTMTEAIAAGPTSQGLKWDIRRALDSDILTVIDFIDQKNEFDRSLNGNPVSALTPKPGKTLGTLFPELPHGQVIFAYDNDKTKKNRSPQDDLPTGFASFCFRYYGFGPPMLWLEDVYVDQTKRSNGAGKALMNELADIAKSNRCTHLAWKADERNIRGLEFYHRLGAVTTGHSGTLFCMKWIPEHWN